MARPRTSKHKPRNHLDKYKETHPELLVSLMKEGKSCAAFCAAVPISETAFYVWLDEFPEFDAAYETGKALSKIWWENAMQENLITQDGAKFNTTGWSMVMRNRFDLTEHRKVRIKGLSKAKTIADKFDVIIDMMERGKLTGNEAQQMSSVLMSGVKIAEAADVEERMKKLEALVELQSASE